MARSNVGGTRGFLRGKVANDLYQVTISEKGRRVQLVRSVEDSREYSNTNEQALARMKMAALMRALSQLKEIVDHSWEGVPYGQLSIAHFVKVNMPYVNWDVYCNFAADSCFMMPEKGKEQYVIGAYQVSSGSLPNPDFIATDDLRGFGGWVPFFMNLGISSPTFADLKTMMGLNADDYITILIQAGRPTASDGILGAHLVFLRMYLSHDIENDFKITASNIGQCFYFEGNCNHELTFTASSGEVCVRLYCREGQIFSEGLSYAIICSRWNGIVWQRNNAVFQDEDGPWQYDMGQNMACQVFHSWFPEWDVDEGWGKYSYDQYPGEVPQNWKRVEGADEWNPIK